MDSAITWAPHPNSLVLDDHALHIWRARLEASQETLNELSNLLSPGESARSERFVVPRDRRHFIVARGTLRSLLGRYVNRAPGSLRIESEPEGKHFLLDNAHRSDLRFNLSHSHGVAVYAFALGRELGIDVEKIRPGFASHEIAQRYFSRQEIDELDLLAPSSYTESFFYCWTRKEAYIKARGHGLHVPLDSFSVTLTRGQAPKLTSPDSHGWSLYDFQPFPEFVAAVVAERFEWKFSFFEAA